MANTALSGLGTTTTSPTPTEKEADCDADAAAAHLLNTDIETGIWALGITDKCISTDVATTPDAEGESRDSQFDFIHIRYQRNHITPKVWRIAFEQTKPGGWIEVIESSHTHTPRPRIKHQLLSAGFVEVEDRAAPAAGSPWQRLGMLLRVVLRLGARDVCEKQGPSVFVIARKPWS